MNDFFVKIGKEKIKTDRRVFLVLLDLSPIKQYVAYQNAVLSSEIKFSDLKELATKADIPYPLFFATKEVIDVHIKDKEKNLFEKLPILMGSNEKSENPRVSYYPIKDEQGREFMAFDFVYLFVRFIFDMERREALPEAGTKLERMTVMKF